MDISFFIFKLFIHTIKICYILLTNLFYLCSINFIWSLVLLSCSTASNVVNIGSKRVSERPSGGRAWEGTPPPPPGTGRLFVKIRVLKITAFSCTLHATIRE